jgi:hypothetical protein
MQAAMFGRAVALEASAAAAFAERARAWFSGSV